MVITLNVSAESANSASTSSGSPGPDFVHPAPAILDQPIANQDLPKVTKTGDIVDNKIELKIGADVASVVKNISKTDLKLAPENEKEDKKEEKRIEPVAPVAPKDPPIVVESKSTQEEKVQKPRNDIDKKEIVDDSNVDGKSEVPLERGK